MRTLRAAGTVFTISQSGSVNVIQQLVDMIRGIQSDISQIVGEYNSEVHPVISSLPQGRSETRWNLPDDTLSAKENGLDGTQLLVDNDASTTSDGGRYWREDHSRPRTVKEALGDLYTTLLTQIDQLRQELASMSTYGIPDHAVQAIGARIFDPLQTSAATSLDVLTIDSQTHLLQLARDLYDDSYDAWTATGTPLLDIKSVRDMVDDLLQIHSSAWNTSSTPTHSSLTTTYRLFPAATGKETELTSDVTVGGFAFDPSHDTGSSFTFVSVAGLARTTSSENNAYGLISFYDMGSPGSIEPGRLVVELSTDDIDIGVIDKISQLLSVITGTPTTNQILNEERVYEVRIKVGGSPVANDACIVSWAGMEITLT